MGVDEPAPLLYSGTTRGITYFLAALASAKAKFEYWAKDNRREKNLGKTENKNLAKPLTIFVKLGQPQISQLSTQGQCTACQTARKM